MVRRSRPSAADQPPTGLLLLQPLSCGSGCTPHCLHATFHLLTDSPVPVKLTAARAALRPTLGLLKSWGAPTDRAQLSARADLQLLPCRLSLDLMCKVRLCTCTACCQGQQGDGARRVLVICVCFH